MQELVENSLRNFDMNKLKRRFAHYCLKVNKSYKEFLWRLADKDISDAWHRAMTYNKRISAARKKARLQKLHVRRCYKIQIPKHQNCKIIVA